MEPPDNDEDAAKNQPKPEDSLPHIIHALEVLRKSKGVSPPHGRYYTSEECTTLLDLWPSVVRLTPANIREHIPDEVGITKDRFSSSYAYLLSTGRNGLWQRTAPDGSLCFILWHPNRDTAGLVNQQLLLIPGKNSTVRSISTMLDEIPWPHSGIDLIRVPEHEKENYLNFRPNRFDETRENALDWAYPCHTLNTELVTEQMGPDFSRLRRDLSQNWQYALDINPLFGDAAREVTLVDFNASVENILVKPGFETQKIFTHLPYYKHLYRMAENTNFLNIAQLLIKPRAAPGPGQLIGYILWDENSTTKTANCFGWIHPSEKNIGEFILYKVCHYLDRKGIRYFNLGGSENPGLDQFKRKFNPVFSENLCTIMATPTGTPVPIPPKKAVPPPPSSPGDHGPTPGS